jgi:Fe-S-cluster containining protein
MNSGDICLTCGLCCDGSLFADVKLQRGDNIAQLLFSLEVSNANQVAKRNSVRARIPIKRLPQPCVAFDGCRCRIYSSRPEYCRQFECLLLQKLKSGAVNRATAEKLIRRARLKTAVVNRLLEALGQTETAGLADRFRSLTKRFERQPLDPKTSALYSRLTLAFHELNLLLHEQFYPAPLH